MTIDCITARCPKDLNFVRNGIFVCGGCSKSIRCQRQSNELAKLSQHKLSKARIMRLVFYTQIGICVLEFAIAPIVTPATAASYKIVEGHSSPVRSPRMRNVGRAQNTIVECQRIANKFKEKKPFAHKPTSQHQYMPKPKQQQQKRKFCFLFISVNSAIVCAYQIAAF